MFKKKITFKNVHKSLFYFKYNSEESVDPGPWESFASALEELIRIVLATDKQLTLKTFKVFFFNVLKS